MDKNKTLIFVHIPKTAGLTFSSILERLYPRSVLCTYTPDAIRGLITIPETLRAQTRLLQGHFAYGVHGYMPCPSKYVTFLRDPVDRAVSLYYFGLETPTVYFHKALVEDNISLAEFVDSAITTETSNFQVRAVSGIVQPGPEVFPAIDETTLPLAKQRLEENFAAFGLTDRFDESLVMFSQALRWPLLGGKLFYERQNVTAKRKQLAEISPETLATIRRHNNLDLQLYQHARELFNKRVKSSPGFHTLLRIYRTFNQLANKRTKSTADGSDASKRESK